ncbi:MAG: hypothetical protein PHT12_00595 [Patescibacteria group bacterium]|nr:hypothetical protein [Patescibacteria group bacterium]
MIASLVVAKRVVESAGFWAGLTALLMWLTLRVTLLVGGHERLVESAPLWPGAKYVLPYGGILGRHDIWASALCLWLAIGYIRSLRRSWTWEYALENIGPGELMPVMAFSAMILSISSAIGAEVGGLVGLAAIVAVFALLLAVKDILLHLRGHDNRGLWRLLPLHALSRGLLFGLLMVCGLALHWGFVVAFPAAVLVGLVYAAAYLTPIAAWSLLGSCRGR